MALWIILGIIVVLIIAVIAMYNSLVTLRQRVKNAWSQIDVQLQRRFDLIPNLVETVKGYMEHEKEVLTKVTDLRSSWSQAQTVAEKASLDNQLSETLKTIMAVSENYPNLKANQNFSELQAELTATENKIAYSRQFYNDSVTRLNTKLETFPSNIIASMFHFKAEDLFVVDNEEAKKNVKVDGSHYDLYSDGLKIYTTLDSRMQKYAEEAVREHLSQDLQPLFDKEKVKKLRPPFSNDMTPAEIEEVLDRSIRQSERYRVLSKQGMSFDEIRKTFDQPLEMQVFTWSGIRDTVMTPLDSIKHYKSFFRSGFMVMQPQTGYIKAYVGGPDYRYFMYDMVSAGKRQVGSTIKPILYTLAMQEGLGPCDKVPNIPQTFILPTGEPWSARGGTKRQGEMVTLRWGLANSENNISAWVLKQFTPEAVAQMAHKMGITSFIDPVPSVFLGTAEITVKEMVAAYSIFANKGVYNSPLPVYRIEDKYGNVLQEFRPESREVITENTAYLMCNLLEGVVTGGTGVRLRYKYKLMNPMGGKTGTTQKHADGWFMGVTPDLVGGVWVGAEDRSIHFQNLANGQGASMALPIWAKFLLKAYADPRLKMSDRPFDRPAGINKRLDCDETISEAEVKEMNNGIREDEEEFY